MKYRREIDGLRAIAVLPVIFFHAGFQLFSGGFVGVDIFFVISGYLITTIILSDIENNRFSLAHFYERRARRILPALFFVMLCTLPFAWLWLSPSHLESFSDSLVAVSVYVSNILFWQQSGYFDTASELKPLLHTWSLAVEEQYYIIFPLMLLSLWKLRKRWIFATLVLIAVTSLAAAQWGAYSTPSATFFLLHTRFWEIAIGALIAFYYLYKKEHINNITRLQGINELLALTGLSLIGYSIVGFSNETPFPSLYALAPTIGTGLLIIYATPQTVVGRLLCTKVMVGIGLISYSAYLWHQPLYVFTRHLSLEEPGTALLLSLAASSLLLAYISWRFVEAPFRNRDTFNRKTIFRFAAAGSLFFIVIGITGHKKDGFPDRFNLPTNLVESFEADKQERILYEKKNFDNDSAWTVAIGPPSSNPSFMFFGDSHASVISGAFNKAAMQAEVSGLFTAGSGCTPLLEIHALRKDQEHNNCNLLNRKVYELVKKKKIKTIFLAARWSYYTDIEYAENKISYISLKETGEKTINESRASFSYGLKKTVEEYSKIGTQVLILPQVPQQLYTAEDGYINIEKNGRNIKAVRKFSVTRNKHESLQKFVMQEFNKHDQLTVIETDDLFCDKDICPIGLTEKSYYSDSNHLSKKGSELLIPIIKNKLSHIKVN